MTMKCYLVRVTACDGRTITSTRLAGSKAAAERMAIDDAGSDLRVPNAHRGYLEAETLKEVTGPYLDSDPPDWDDDPTLRIYNRVPSAVALAC